MFLEKSVMYNAVNNLSDFVRMNDEKIIFIGTRIGFVVVSYIGANFLFRKHYGSRDGQFINITETDFTIKNPTFAETAPTQYLSGKWLKIILRTLNSRFCRWFIWDSIVDLSLIELIRTSHCNHHATFYPVKTVREDDYEVAKECDKIDFSHLKNSFDENLKWKPVTIEDYTNAYKSKKTTPLEVAKNIIEKIEEVNSKMKIFCDFKVELILEQAKQSTDRWNTGTEKGDLDGVPIVIKDQIDIIGLTVRNGLPFPVNNPAKSDAAIIERIKSHGMMILGLVNMHQIGLSSFGTNSSKFHGDCRNPHNPDYYCGASSSGTGSAVALGLAPCGIGSDGGGSVRIPAAFCGISCIKPSCGRIPQRGYIFGTNSTLGPMCSTMIDCIKIYAILAGPDNHEASSISIGQPKIKIPTEIPLKLNGVKIGVDYNWTQFKVTDKVKFLFQQKLRWLSDKGCEIISIVIPELDYCHAAHVLTFMHEMAGKCREYLETGAELGGDLEFAMLVQMEKVYAGDYVQANKIRTKFMKIMEKIFEEVDYIATPTSRKGPPKSDPQDYICGRVDAGEINNHSQFTKLANFVGVPAISTPMGVDGNNMPVGFHLMANWWKEDELMQIAVMMEKNHTYKKPTVSFKPF